ncbi:MAG: acireductone synthase [Planctomycetota bacterium]
MTLTADRPGQGAKAILLDIEGTTSSISFVVDTMFPYVRDQVAAYLARHHTDDACQAACRQMAADSGSDSEQIFGRDWASSVTQAKVVQHVNQLMDVDSKTTGLKKLQGLIWKDAFESGAMVSHLYEDVLPAINGWVQSGRSVWIYSSGSVNAQKLFFGHTPVGSILDRFSGHWDTQVGSKKETASYQSIASTIQESSGLAANQILFVSDVVAELDAAAEAGLQTALSIRPGNQPIDGETPHPKINSFGQIAG